MQRIKKIGSILLALWIMVIGTGLPIFQHICKASGESIVALATIDEGCGDAPCCEDEQSRGADNTYSFVEESCCLEEFAFIQDAIETITENRTVFDLSQKFTTVDWISQTKATSWLAKWNTELTDRDRSYYDGCAMHPSGIGLEAERLMVFRI